MYTHQSNLKSYIGVTIVYALPIKAAQLSMTLYYNNVFITS